MSEKPHLRFLSKKQLSEVKIFKFNYGYDKKRDQKHEEEIP